ncbi:agmatine deiminase family protein [Undibacterium squillarum]|uniref:agmatine deiminase family protein n=1 Tax=Undibacterium squillarum TaxID=1131567 RepID=UPI0035AD936E
MTNVSPPLTRRRFLHRCAAFSAFSVTPGLLSACGGSGGGDSAGGNADQSSTGEPSAPSASAWVWPDESAAHAASWMSFQVSAAIWGRDMVAPVQEALARIANAIIPFEPLNVIVAPENMARARALLDARIRLISGTADDLWIRDTGCITVRNAQGQKRAVSFNFNGWGNKQAYSRDATVAQQMSQQQGVNLVRSRLVLEGGALETDGEGTAIITESCVLNANRNPGWTKSAVEAELKATLGFSKVIWLPGIAGKDITDGHTDFYARFVKPGVVLANLETDPGHFEYAVTRKHLDILRSATDAQGRRLQITTLSPPAQTRPDFAGKDFAAGYINFYLVNGGVLCPEFGDTAADNQARTTLAALYPDRKIVMLNIDAIAAGGGGIHCSTMHQCR